MIILSAVYQTCEFKFYALFTSDIYEYVIMYGTDYIKKNLAMATYILPTTFFNQRKETIILHSAMAYLIAAKENTNE